MKVVPRNFNTPQPPTEEKLRVLADRARMKVPLFPETLSPEDFEENEHYIRAKEVQQALTFFLSFWKANEHDDDAEITYRHVARCIRSDPKKPSTCVRLLPEPCSNPNIKTSRYVWKWHEVKHYIRRYVATMVIKEMAGRL